jgi:hypothetical protein
MPSLPHIMTRAAFAALAAATTVASLATIDRIAAHGLRDGEAAAIAPVADADADLPPCDFRTRRCAAPAHRSGAEPIPPGSAAQPAQWRTQGAEDAAGVAAPVAT